MADDLERLRAAMAARLQQIGMAPDDPRVAPMLAQVQALMQQRAASMPEGVVPFAPTHAGTRSDEGGRAAAAVIETLPAHLRDLVQSYSASVRSGRERVTGGLAGVGWFFPVPALSSSEEGRKL